MTDPGQEIKAPVAKTAGEQDHSDPWRYSGEAAEPPGNPGTGKQAPRDGQGYEGEI